MRLPCVAVTSQSARYQAFVGTYSTAPHWQEDMCLPADGGSFASAAASAPMQE